MRSIHSSALLFLLLAAAMVTGILHGEPEKDRKQSQIDAMIRQLSDQKYRQRQAARQKLVTIGEEALPAVRKAELSSDLDLSTLAKQIVRSILEKSAKSKSVGMEFSVVDEGRFEMGSPRSERNRRPNESLHLVTISRPFLLGTHEVTQDQFAKVMKYNPSFHSATGAGRAKVAELKTGGFPVDSVSWYDAIEFCNRLSKLDGYDPYYEMAKILKETDSIQSAEVAILGGNGYRLPTEAEWEFGCRAWTTQAYHFGFQNTGKEANTRPGPAYGYGGGADWKALGRTAEVGSYKPNFRGLYDMHGNIAEWCWDYFEDDYYSRSPERDPTGPEKGNQRLLRGGSWMVAEGSCRSATRFSMVPGERKEYAGFRVARTP